MTTVSNVTPTGFGHTTILLSTGSHVTIHRGEFVPEVGDVWPPEVDAAAKRKKKAPEYETWK